MIIITGASAGIGKATAQAFAEQKKDLFLLARRQDRLTELARELTSRHGVEVLTAPLDVRDAKSVRSFAEAHEKSLSRATVLVNNAGLAKGLGTIQEGNTDDWDTMIQTNLNGLLYVTRSILPHFIRQRRGHVINLGSVAGHWVYPKGNVYCATKYGVKALTEALRLDLHGTGVRVTEIAPGMVETEFSLVRLGDAERAKAVYEKMTPLSARDIADAIVWAALRPAHVNIQEIVLYPADQASPTLVHRA